jgi:hypothetical protein
MVADYTASGGAFMVGQPRQWLAGQDVPLQDVDPALAPDGKRFVVIPQHPENDVQNGSSHVTFLLNFFDELRRRVPADK